jgi:hypothetical protein
VNGNIGVRRAKRVGYTFIGLLAGDAILLAVLLLNAMRTRAALLAAHVGQPWHAIPLALEMFVVYAIFSIVGWLLVGLPTALYFPVPLILRLPWPFRILIGAMLGPMSLFVLLVVLSGGRVMSAGFTDTGMRLIWGYASLVSAVAFPSYAALLGRAGGAKQESS